MIDVSILKDAPFLLYIASNVPTVMAVYSVYSYIPAVGTGLDTRLGRGCNVPECCRWARARGWRRSRPPSSSR